MANSINIQLKSTNYKKGQVAGELLRYEGTFTTETPKAILGVFKGANSEGNYHFEKWIPKSKLTGEFGYFWAKFYDKKDIFDRFSKVFPTV
jgi:hypothetical protein